MAVGHSLALQPAGTMPSPAASSTSSPKLVKAAHEFEAQMMKELLQPMTGEDPLLGDSDDGEDSGLALGSGSGSGGALADFASEALGQALSERGGFGIANKIIHELAPAAHAPEVPAKVGQSPEIQGQKRKLLPAKVTPSPHGNTVMRKTQ
jgi:Rod binding domain-containing protein